jgi:hypothetical protein
MEAEDRDKEGKFKPGNQEGKKRGPNKVSQKVKDSIVKFLEDNVDEIQDSFDQLKAREKLEFISSILPYAAPKLSSVTSENKNEMTVTVQFKDAE